MQRPADAAGHEYTLADLRVTSTVPLPELSPAGAPGTPPVDAVRVVWTTTAAPFAADWYHQWGDDDIWARFGTTAGGYVIDFPETCVFAVSSDARLIDVQVRPDVPMGTVRHLLLNQVLPLVLSRLRPLVLHAGAVAADGAVTAFVGPTGSGKSTLVAACARLGAEVMADDSLVVYPEPGAWRAIPSYPSVRLWESSMDHLGWAPGNADAVAHYTDKRRVIPETGGWRFAGGPRPLAHIVVLASEQFPRRPVAVELFSQVFRLDIRDNSDAVRLFHLVADLARGVRVSRVDEPCADRQALDVAERLMRDAALQRTPDPGIVSKHG